jgi:hypothetical protein
MRADHVYRFLTEPVHHRLFFVIPCDNGLLFMTKKSVSTIKRWANNQREEQGQKGNEKE